MLMFKTFLPGFETRKAAKEVAEWLSSKRSFRDLKPVRRACARPGRTAFKTFLPGFETSQNTSPDPYRKKVQNVPSGI